MAGGRARGVDGTSPRTEAVVPMRREGYLGRECVQGFIEWLRLLVRDERPFKHQYRMLKPACDWSCCSLYDAHERYCWGSSDFWATQAKLDHLCCQIRAAERDNDNDAFVEAACRILKWGGVAPHNCKKLCELGERALPTFRAAACLLRPTRADTSQLGGVQFMNSGWTKVYSLILDAFPMYDGRVGAAMGYLVRLYCTEKHMGGVPEPLEFRWLDGKGNHNRNPSKGCLQFRRLSYTDPRTWAKCNVRAAWILSEVCGEGRFGDLPDNRRPRALEAALFMIGYELPRDSP